MDENLKAFIIEHFGDHWRFIFPNYKHEVFIETPEPRPDAAIEALMEYFKFGIYPYPIYEVKWRKYEDE